MRPPTKDQADIGVDNPTIDASDGADIPDSDEPNKDYARQEYKNESDINYMLSKFGVTQPRGTPTYGEVDESIDLQTAITAVREAREGYAKLPDDLRAKFTSMEGLLTAVENGSLVIKNEEAPAPVPTEAQLMQQRLDKLEAFHNNTASRQQEL